MEIPTLHEPRRGCGYRKGGGLYLVAGKPEEPCDALPVLTKVCPCCGEGVRPARGFTWVDADQLLDLPQHTIPYPPTTSPEHVAVCPLGQLLGRAGLVWVGEAFYATPQEFMAEATRMGISRRITAVPRDFVAGETWVLLGHRKAATERCGNCDQGAEEHPGPGESTVTTRCRECNGRGRLDVAGVFTLFRPERVEYVVRGDEGDAELERLAERGIQPVRVEPVEEQGKLEGAA